ncbi:peptide MFS transporter [Spirillospora sp. CA-253888]
MSATRGVPAASGTAPAAPSRRLGFRTLLAVDLWERFGFYGMAAVLILYLTAGEGDGGLGMAPQTATAVFAAYMSLAFMAGLPGGWLTDRVLGMRAAVLLGGALIVTGYTVLTVPSRWALLPGLGLVVAGTGLVKPALAALVAEVGGAGTRRREEAFSLFYVCIQISALVAPAVIGVAAEKVAWPLGFACAALGMAVGAVQFAAGLGRFGDVGTRPRHPIGGPELARVAGRAGLLLLVPAAVLAGAVGGGLVGLPAVLAVLGLATLALPFVYLRRLWRASGGTLRLRGFVALMLASAVFWMLFSQSGSVLGIFAERHTDRTVAGLEAPASWFQSLHPLFVLLAAPLLARAWRRAGDRVNVAMKFSGALVVAGAGFALMSVAASLSGAGPVSPLWLVAVYALYSCGEIALAPAGLALAASVAPDGHTGRFLAVNGLFGAVGVVAGGQLFRLTKVMSMSHYFLLLGTFTLVVGLVVGAFSGRLQKMLP